MLSSIVTVPAPPIPKPRRAKKAKWCHECQGRIPAGALYLEWSPWRWTHLTDACPDGWSTKVEGR